MRIRDCNGGVRFDSVPTSCIRAQAKALQDGYLRTARDWQRDGKAPSLPAPEKPEFRVLSTLVGWDAERQARARASDYQKKHDWERMKKREEETKAPAAE